MKNAAAVITYHVLLGPYVVTVKMLNMNSRIFDRLTPSMGAGAFGLIVPLSDENESFVAKRIGFTKSIRIM